jgi:hypothetical protein
MVMSRHRNVAQRLPSLSCPSVMPCRCERLVSWPAPRSVEPWSGGLSYASQDRASSVAATSRKLAPEDKRVGGGWGSAMICIATDEV